MIMNPITFVFRAVKHLQHDLQLYMRVNTALSFVTLIDVFVRVRSSSKVFWQDLTKLEKIIGFVDGVKVSIVDVVILVVRLQIFFDADSFLFFSVYIIGFLRVIQWMLLPTPLEFVLKKFTRLDSHQSNLVNTVFEIAYTVINFSNFLTCFWIFLGTFDYSHKPDFEPPNSWIV